MKNCSTCHEKVYPFEKIETNEKWYHRRCFRCSADGCKLTLTLQNFQCNNGLLYCNKHVPKYLPVSPKVFKAQNAYKPKPKISCTPRQAENLKQTQFTTNVEDIDNLMVSLNTTSGIPLE
ncbi:hypothetical protein BGW37DRAFT_503392 [Umbelopsis sp. PMI_123]|nr:hypothetical protein BGW37DRAFT_503392 [Umbelopsis sp. PMI_123]